MTPVSLSTMFNVTAGDDPAYLVLTALDRNEYTAGAAGSTGFLDGNGDTAMLTALPASMDADGRGAGMVFTYDPSTGQYYNSDYGSFDAMQYFASSSLGDVTNVSLFGTDDLNLALADATDPIAMFLDDPAGYLGSATFVTQPGTTVPSQATPDSIAATAESFIGQTWNSDGCWVLASTIAADAGASLPVQSTVAGLSGQANGEWIVAFNGPAGQTGDWQSLIKAGDVIDVAFDGGGGHIATCVSGSGATAVLVDNAVFYSAQGTLMNSANDGSANDIIIQPPHLASQEFADVDPTSVVIYELDTPVVTATESTMPVTANGVQSAANLFSATDPGDKTITEWQIYSTSPQYAFEYNGVTYSDTSATAPLTVSSLNAVSLIDGPGTNSVGTVEARAFNGSYWGDWQSSNVQPDVPLVTAVNQIRLVAANTSNEFGALFTASDPMNSPITEYQVCSVNPGYSLQANGAGYSNTSENAPLTVTSLNNVSLISGSTNTGNDTVDVRAFNGSEWSAWTSATIETVPYLFTPGSGDYITAAVAGSGSAGTSGPNAISQSALVGGTDLMVASGAISEALSNTMTFGGYQDGTFESSAWSNATSMWQALQANPGGVGGIAGLASAATASQSEQAMALFKSPLAVGGAQDAISGAVGSLRSDFLAPMSSALDGISLHT